MFNAKFVSHLMIFVRQLALIAGAFGAVFGLFKLHDWSGIYRYLSGHEGYSALLAAGGFASAVWSQVKGSKRKWVEDRLAILSAIVDKVAGDGAADAAKAGAPVDAIVAAAAVPGPYRGPMENPNVDIVGTR